MAILTVLFGAASGCTSGDDGVQVEAWVSERIPTVISVHGMAEVDGAEGGTITVTSGDEERRYPVQLGPENGFDQLLLGLKPDTEYRGEVTVETPDGPVASEPFTLATGPVPASLPHLDHTVHDASRMPAGYVVTSVLAFPSAVVILDDEGDYVWWYQLGNEDAPVTRGQLSRDGEWMLFLVSELVLEDGAGEGGDQPLVRVRLDGSDRREDGIPGAHHDFVELPDGSIGAIAHDLREVDDEGVRGDRIVELAPDGTLTEVWSIWDHVAYDPTQVLEPGTGWTHANALDYDEAEDAYYLSVRNFGCIYKIDRASGDILWTLGSPDSDFRLPDGGTHFFALQHQFDVLDEGILVMDNGTDTAAGSRAVEVTLDLSLAAAEPVWTYAADPPLYTFALGDVQRLAGGETMVTWSTAGQIDLVDPAGAPIARWNASVGGGIGYSTWTEHLPGAP